MLQGGAGLMVPNASGHSSSYLPGELSLRDLLTVVFKRRWLIAVFAVLTLATAILVTLLKPPVYEVEATLVVNTSRAEIPIAPKESPQLLVSKIGEEDLNTEIEILKSRQLIEEVLDSLPERPPAGPVSWLNRAKARVLSVMAGPKLTRREQMILHLQQELRIRSIRKSNVIRVGYRSQNPDWATEVVGVLTDRYLERRAEMYQSPMQVTFFEEQMSDAQQQLHDREAELEAFLSSAGITMVRGPEGTDALAVQKNLVLERLARVQNELTDAQVEYEESQYKVASLKDRIAREPARLESSNRMNQDAALEEIEKGIAALELERDGLLQDFKPDSRFVRDIDAQIEMATQRLAELRAEAGSIDGTEVNPIHQQLKSELVQAESQLEGAKGRYLSLQDQVTAMSRELDQLNAKAFEIERLRRDTQAAEESYSLYRKKHEEARISAAMDQEKIINVTVAQKAQRPLRPMPRGLRMTVLAALLFGITGGLGLAFGVEYYVDHTFTTGEEMERRLGLPHLASVPEEA